MSSLQTSTSSETESKSYSIKDWQKGYESQPNEYEYLIEDIEGEIPKELEGTLFRNGAGLLDVHGTPVRHPFDGDGMVCSFSFQNGSCYFRNQFVKTKEYLEEQKAGKMLYRGVFGTQKPGGWLANVFDIKIKNIANTNIIYWGDKLLALWEGAQPYQLNPQNLDTIGLDDLDGILSKNDVFSAHPRIDPASQFNQNKPSLINFNIKPGLQSKITIYELDEIGKLVQTYSHLVEGFCFIHDFVITPNYCIFMQNPVSFNPLPFVFGLKGAGECVKFEPNRPSKIIIIPRKSPHQDVKTLEIDAGFIFHHINAFEDGNQIFIDSISYKSLTQTDPNLSYKEVDFNTLAPGQFWRFTIDLKTENVTRKLMENRSIEFPNINRNKVGRKYRYFFTGAVKSKTQNGPLQALLKVDLQTEKSYCYSFAPKGFVGEPIFVPKPNAQSEDDGWVLMLVYDSAYHRSDLVIFEGLDITNPIAKLHLKHHIPYGLHGNWINQVF